MSLLIAHAWCLKCGHLFLTEENKLHSYKCPKCSETISFETETLRYIVDK